MAEISGETWLVLLCRSNVNVIVASAVCLDVVRSPIGGLVVTDILFSSRALASDFAHSMFFESSPFK
ncbi:hypothetical protein D3C85_1679540 [compost metagenome]